MTSDLSLAPQTHGTSRKITIKTAIKMQRLIIACSLTLITTLAQSASPQDTTPNNTSLSRAEALRVITLTPHLTELLYELNAGKLIVGTVEFSGYSEKTKTIPLVGTGIHVSLEKIVALKPDLVLAWSSGMNPSLIESLKRANISVHISDTQTIEHFMKDINTIGSLIQREKEAHALVRKIKSTINDISAYQNEASAFIQVWPKPLYTVGKPQIITQALSLCGVRNIFGDITAESTQVSIEAVLARKPNWIIQTASSTDPVDNEPSLLKGLQRTTPTIRTTLLSRPNLGFFKEVKRICQVIHSQTKKAITNL